MKQQSPDYIRRVANSFLRVSPVEDGNTPSTVLDQGFIYTSESIDSNYYDTEYNSPILSFTSLKNKTGKTFTYEIVVEYTAKEGASATNPGLYGSNLIKNGDFFTITSYNDTHDYVKGVVIDILGIDVSGPGPGDIYTYEYNLLCNITEGDPLRIENSDNFVWKRRIYTDRLNESIKEYPENLLATAKQDGAYFRWVDPSGSALKFNFRIREKNQTDGGGITYFDVPGTSANGNGEISLQAFFGKDAGAYFKKITAVKILNFGDRYSVVPIVSIIGTGSGAIISCSLDDSGSLKKESFRIYEADHVTSTIRIHNKNTEYQPAVSSFVENLSTDVCVKTVADLGNGDWEITLIKVTGDDFTFDSSYASSVTNQELIVHTGIIVIDGGNNYKKSVYTNIKKYPAEDIYFIPAGTLSSGEYYWSVCSIFDENNKKYTEWSPEEFAVIT